MAAYNHSLADVFVILDGNLITEFADGDAISIELMEDDVIASQGMNGAVAFSHRPNSIAEVTLTILQTSPDNTRIHNAVEAIRLARRGSMSLVVQDGRGTTLFESPQVVPKKRAPIAFATEAGSREWSFYAVVGTYTVGQNELA